MTMNRTSIKERAPIEVRTVRPSNGAGHHANGRSHAPSAAAAFGVHGAPAPIGVEIAGATDPLYCRRLAAAKELSQKTPLTIGGEIAVAMHGALSKAPGLVLFTPEVESARRVLERAGFKSWLAEATFALAGVEAKLAEVILPGKKDLKTEVFQGVRVPVLADLIAALILRARSAGPAGLKGLADAGALVAAHRLDKRFGARLPASIRASFNEIVDSQRDRAGAGMARHQ